MTVSEHQDLRSAALRLPNGQLPLAGIATAGQPAAEDVRLLARAGYKVVVDLRAPEEPRGFDEAAVVRDAGMEYVNLPVDGPPSDETLDVLRQVLRNSEGQPVLVHCGSANRVGGALIPYLVLDRGEDPQEAVDLAIRIGLRSWDLADRAAEYIRRNENSNHGA